MPDTCPNPVHHSKTILYGIPVCLIVIALVLFLFTVLSKPPVPGAAATTQSASSSPHATLTPAQAAQRATALDNVLRDTPPLSASQAAARDAQLKSLPAQ